MEYNLLQPYLYTKLSRGPCSLSCYLTRRRLSAYQCPEVYIVYFYATVPVIYAQLIIILVIYVLLYSGLWPITILARTVCPTQYLYPAKITLYLAFIGPSLSQVLETLRSYKPSTCSCILFVVIIPNSVPNSSALSQSLEDTGMSQRYH